MSFIHVMAKQNFYLAASLQSTVSYYLLLSMLNIVVLLNISVKTTMHFIMIIWLI